MIRNSNFRRFHEQLKKLKIKRILKHHNCKIDKKLAENEKYIGKMSHTPHPCSCDMCCNKRRLKFGSIKDKLSLQEKKANLNLLKR